MHNLIVGASYSGKSWLAKRFAADAIKRGQNVSVFDPLKSSWPKGSKCFSTVEAFLDHIQTAQSAHVFIDEAKVLWNTAPKEADRILYQGRHQGLLSYVIGQRAEGMIPPNARDQCGKLFAFKQSPKDAQSLAASFTSDELLALPRLKKLEFIATDSYRLGNFRLDFSGGSPPIVKPR